MVTIAKLTYMLTRGTCYITYELKIQNFRKVPTNHMVTMEINPPMTN